MDPSVNPAFVIFAAVAPLLIAFVKQSGFTTQQNALIAFACYVVVGIVGAVLSGVPLDVLHLVDLITIATLVGTTAYNLIWNNIGVVTLASGRQTPSLDERLTAATSIIKG